jgi:hypothetical protein
VDFILFPGGCPYGPEPGTMTKNFANARMDMCWLHIISPKVWRGSISSEWIGTVAANKSMALGGDYKLVDGTYAHAQVAGNNVAAVLAEKVLMGYLTEEEALEPVALCLRKDAIRIFNLPLP